MLTPSTDAMVSEITPTGCWFSGGGDIVGPRRKCPAHSLYTSRVRSSESFSTSTTWEAAKWPASCSMLRSTWGSSWCPGGRRGEGP